MKTYAIPDEELAALFWVRGQMLGVKRWKQAPDYDLLIRLVRRGWVHVFHSRRVFSPIWTVPASARVLLNEIIAYETDNPRFSAHEGPSALLHGDTLFTWSHFAAVREIEDLRRMRQRNEERKAKRSGRVGCAKTRCRAEPRPLVAICVDDCRHQ